MNFYKCSICGRISNEKEMCCGKEMDELIFTYNEESAIKHVPIISRNNNEVIVKVGQISHPMTIEHRISVIYLQTSKRLLKKDINNEEEAIAVFNISEDEEILNAYSYCNLHGLWKSY